MVDVTNISTADTTPGNNASLNGVSILGTGLVSTADDTFRNEMALLAKFYDDFGGVNTVGGTANAIAITTSTVFTALASGMRFTFKPSADNTGAVTLNLDSLGAKAIRKISGSSDVALAGAELLIGRRAEILYDSTANGAAGAWILLNSAADGPYQSGHLFGLTLSNNGSDATNDIDIAAGTARDSTDVENMVLASALTKQLDVNWAVGTAAGGLDTGAIANGTYHVWLIKRVDTGVVDVLYSTSASAPTMPSNYTLKRRIGSILRESAAIAPFLQDGDVFMRKAVANDISVSNYGTSAVTRTLSVPVGIRVRAVGSVAYSGSAASAGTYVEYLSDLSATDVAASSGLINSLEYFGLTNSFRAMAPFDVFTNTSAQIRSRAVASDTAVTMRINTKGWIDTRGRI